MPKKIRLVSVIEREQKISVRKTSENGKYSYYHFVKMKPDEEYELPEDQLLVQSLLNATDTKMYNKNLEERLQEAGIEYSVEMCPSCRGRVKKIKYKMVEVVD